MHTIQFAIRTLVVLSAILAFTESDAAGETQRVASEPARPNILFFIADNWAWPHAGVLGDPTAQTPIFDQLAREGVVLNNAFCPVPSCSPTRSCILTGRAAHQLEEAASLWSGFPRKFTVFTESLRAVGYEVGYSGKGWSPGNYLDFGWTENPVGEQYQNFAEFMKFRDASKPFFFWSGNTETSLSKWRYEPEAWATLDANSLRIPAELPDAEEVRLSMLAYYGCVGRIDSDAGRCIDVLKQQGLFDETFVVYTSDNGWQMPRGLANCYDTGTRVPLVIRWGTHISAGIVLNEFVSLTDFAPTFLELAGVDIPMEMTGRSMVDLLLQRPEKLVRDAVFLERERHANVRRGNLSYPIRGVRTRDFLYLRNLRPERFPAGDPKAYWAVGDFGDVDGSRAKFFLLDNATKPEVTRFFELSFAKRPAEELYDLRVDPQQLVNVADDSKYATSKNELGKRIEQWMVETDDPRVNPNYDAWDNYPYFGGRVVDENGAPVSKRKP